MLTPFISIQHQENAFIRQLRQSSFSQFTGLRLTEILFDLQYYHNDLFSYYGISLPAHLNKAVDKRRAEYLASRYAARMAMNDYGITDFTLHNDADRAPVWPASVSGSLTHTAGRAVVITALAKEGYHIGVDVEQMIAEPTAIEMSKMIVSASELNYFSQAGISLVTALTLAFSLKESLYKALYPQIKKFIDFHSAEVIHLELASGHAVLQLTGSLSEALPAGRQFNGYFQQHRGEVLTVIVDQSRP